SGVFTLDLKLDIALTGTATIEIFNTYDQKVYAETATITNGELNRRIDATRQLPASMYMVRVIAGDEVYSGSILIQR
ncbi:MAG TPA: hypothetical protein PLD84_10100, partial [Chitinophagales bacterium]|nr:hypothetical protein [Chitinophagales bacterium]